MDRRDCDGWCEMLAGCRVATNIADRSMMRYWDCFILTAALAVRCCSWYLLMADVLFHPKHSVDDVL